MPGTLVCLKEFGRMKKSINFFLHMAQIVCNKNSLTAILTTQTLNWTLLHD